MADRRTRHDDLALLIGTTVSASRMAMDAAVVAVCAALAVMASVIGAPLLQWYALGGVAVWAGLRLLSARRAATDFVARADEPPTPMCADERDSLPPSLMAPCDARTLAELDAIVRALHAPDLRVHSWVGSAFYIAALGTSIAGLMATQDPDTTAFSAALLGVAAACCIPVAVWSVFVWANQRAIDALFTQVEGIIGGGVLPIGELPDDAAVRRGENDTIVLVRERLRRSFRPRPRRAPRPSVIAILVIAGMLGASAFSNLVFSTV